MNASFIIQQTLLCMVPFLIVALAGAFSEHSGIINLGLDGEMIFGAFIGCIFCRFMVQGKVFGETTGNSQWLFVLGMLISALAGAIFSLLLSFSAIHMKVDQTIAGTALNMLAPALVCTFGLLFFNGERITSGAMFQLTAGSYSNAAFSAAVKSNSLLSFFFDQIYISTYIVILLFIFLSFWLYRSKTGTHLRACGEHPQAAASVGINVFKMRYLGTTISGALAGLGGFVYIATQTGTEAENSVGGLGFLALAIMIFGNWNPLYIGLGSLLFGFVKCVGVLAPQIPFLQNLPLPSYFYNMLPYVIVLVVLMLTRKKSGCPKAEGIPYDAGMR
ncbi:MAG: ABC transporter permease [Bacilli bacterium]